MADAARELFVLHEGRGLDLEQAFVRVVAGESFKKKRKPPAFLGVSRE
jgi:hypothetical protein